MNIPTGQLSAWSHSKVVEFDKCKYRTWLLHVAKVPEPQRALAAGKTEQANDRGTRIHNAAEAFVRGTGPFPKEMKSFETELFHMQDCFKRGLVSLEGEWGMDRDWQSTEWKTAWLRLKVDALVFVSETEAVVIDYKSGRKYGNEVKHAEQTQLYALVAALRFPKLETIHTELWYVDQKDDESLTQQTYSRAMALRFRPSWHSRGSRLTACTDWPANPNKFSCQWCMYGPGDSGDCQVGVRNASLGKKTIAVSKIMTDAERADHDARMAANVVLFAKLKGKK